MPRQLKFATVALVASLLFLPLLQNRTGLVPIQSLKENRTLNPRPAFTVQALTSGTNEFQTGFERYFDDRYGFRDLLIRIYNQLDYSCFHYSDRVYFGKEGWLYYRSGVDVEEPRLERYTDAQRNDAYRDVTELAAFLKSKGIRLIVMPIPLKNTIYPEYLPDDAPHRSPDTFLQRLRVFLSSRHDLTLVDAQPTMLELKGKSNVFHRTDFHWTDATAGVVARQLVDGIGAMERHPSVWRHPLKIVRRELSGGQANFVPMLFPLKELTDFVEQDWKETSHQVAPPPSPFETVWVSDEKSRYLLPPTLVFGDSFMDGMTRAGYYIYFQKLYRVRTQSIGMPALLTQLPPDVKYFVLEFIETVAPDLVLADLPSQLTRQARPLTPRRP